MSTKFLLQRCEKGTLTHGSVVDGRFEGFIQTHQGMYYVEPSERYLRDKDVPYHSVIYHEGDIMSYPMTGCHQNPSIVLQGLVTATVPDLRKTTLLFSSLEKETPAVNRGLFFQLA
ncbi:unnamed protein product [Oncorhynchus mykiss]|uniref:Uncharacterized protein n=1 Tax=Oncorhynchus mykiss TaxID=8022 RepID=A0A060YAI1_ONCMY|nr:unnamed protein product [Oncorhynchus mykiss]